MTTGACNIAIGPAAMGAMTVGAVNIAIGDNAMAGVTTGSQPIWNIALGQNALLGGASTTGCLNIAMGLEALKAVTSGSNNIGIGRCAGCDVSTQSCVVNIGIGMNNTTSSTTCIGGDCLMTACFYETSDCRSKCDIKDLSYGLDFIKLLRPVSYKWKPQPDKLDEDGNLIEVGEKHHRGPRSSFGLLGQEVKGALTKLGLGYNDFGAYSDQEYENRNNPDWKKSYTMENKTVGLSYIGFIAPLIKAVQELSNEVTDLKAQLKTS